MPLEVVAPAEAPEPGLAVGATIVGEVVANLPVAGASAAGNVPLPGASAAGRDEAATGDRVRAHLGSAPEERPAPGDRPASERSGMAGGPAQPRPRDDGAAGQPGDDASRPTCTVPQLRRFIKSRPWVPMHELRRRFGIAGVEDDVSPMRVGDQRIYIGLPPTEARLMAELLTAGDVGYELSLDPVVPVVVGVYPMRPVPRA